MIDVLVLGLGTAGSAVAALCARAGLRVVGLERGALDSAGAHWLNGVPGWVFDEVGIPRPEGEELSCASPPFHLVAGWGPHRVTLRGADLLDVDMRHYNARLQRLAVESGAELREHVRVEALADEGVQTAEGTLDARCIVDATGAGGLALLGQERAAPTDVCAASQAVFAVADPQGAQRFFAERDAELGEVLCFTGIAGGFSIVNVSVHDGTVSLLTGSVPGLGNPPGPTLMARFVDDQPWIGERLFGGSRAIPLLTPPVRITAGKLVAVGDAGGMVHAAHGSGIGQQLLAGHLLATVLARGGSPWDFEVRWQREHMGQLASADLFRRYTSTLTPEQLEVMITSGLMTEGIASQTLVQRPPVPSFSELAQLVRAAPAARTVLAGLAGTVVRMGAVEAWYSRYPDQPQQVETWARRRDWLAGR